MPDSPCCSIESAGLADRSQLVPRTTAITPEARRERARLRSDHFIHEFADSNEAFFVEFDPLFAVSDEIFKDVDKDEVARPRMAIICTDDVMDVDAPVE